MQRNIQQLGFSITTKQASLQAEQSGPDSDEYLSVDVRPLADGAPLLGKLNDRDAFDALALITRGRQSGELFLYNCSCRVPSCAGIDDAVQVRVGDDEVTWLFPDRTFRGGPDDAGFPPDEPMLVRFDLVQYLDALHDLECRLCELAAASASPAVLEPDNEPNLDRTIEEVIADAKLGEQRRGEQSAFERVALRHLYDQEILFEWPNGARKVAGVRRLLRLMALELRLTRTGNSREDPSTLPDALFDEDSILADEIAPVALESDEALFVLVCGLPWETTAFDLRDAEDGTDRDGGIAPPGSGWAEAKMTLRPTRA